MNKRLINIHGDNIVECERIFKLILNGLNVHEHNIYFSSLACISSDIKVNDTLFKFTLYPGFNSGTKKHWNRNIFDCMSNSILDEKPDVILTEVVDNKEVPLVAIEFCSALQAGNQAWQRSGRAYSAGRSLVPYIYIVDFVKYELDEDRKREALRFPNPVVPFSYINYSKNLNNLVVQAFFKSEEFHPSFDDKLKEFDTNIFSEGDVTRFIINTLLRYDNTEVSKTLLSKNLDMTMFLSKSNKPGKFTSSDWKQIYDYGNLFKISKSYKDEGYGFKKKKAKKSTVGKIDEFNDIVAKYSHLIGSKDLPFGLIPKENRANFIKEIIDLYEVCDENVQKQLLKDEDMVVCMLKCFKPRGDDNRPDRGTLPLIRKLLDNDIEIMTLIYGPILDSNLSLLNKDIKSLASQNGLWKSIIALSDFILLDSPILKNKSISSHISVLIDNTNIKSDYMKSSIQAQDFIVNPSPVSLQENDVDTILHVLFKHIVPNTFEGLCNPPGGDWSGLSIIGDTTEYRWLSLPRVSAGSRKRPDHITQILDNQNPILLITESKEKGSDLEKDVGPGLKDYVKGLSTYMPSVEKSLSTNAWSISYFDFDISDYKLISIGAFLYNKNNKISTLQSKSKCDLIIAMEPLTDKWNLHIHSFTPDSDKIKDLIIDSINKNTDPINIFAIANTESEFSYV